MVIGEEALNELIVGVKESEERDRLLETLDGREDAKVAELDPADCKDEEELEILMNEELIMTPVVLLVTGNELGSEAEEVEVTRLKLYICR
jgi:hypothetical protein